MPDLDWTWACFLDLAAGAAFAAELSLGFHLSFVATSHGQQREVRTCVVVVVCVRWGSTSPLWPPHTASSAR